MFNNKFNNIKFNSLYNLDAPSQNVEIIIPTINNNSYANIPIINDKYDGYKIERRIHGDTFWIPICFADYNESDFKDNENLVNGNTYEYKIKQINKLFESSYSSIVTIQYTMLGIRIISVEITPNPCYINSGIIISVGLEEY